MTAKRYLRDLFNVLVLLFVSVVITSCATGPKVEQKDLSYLPACTISGNAFAGDNQYAVLDISEARMAQIRLIDHIPFKPKNCDYYHIALPPGEHIIHFVYSKSIHLLHPRGRDPVSLKFSAKAGKHYQIIVDKHTLKSLYNCRVEDVASGKVLHEIDDCDNDAVRYPALDEILEVFGGRDSYLKYQDEWWPKDDFEQIHKYLKN